jgi:alkylation response protein AidB-like acyl-CoA dehydrogenase
MCGGAQQVLELSVAHAKTREQFGRPIGSFQAIAHKCADMFVRVESARSATYYAAWALAAGRRDAHVSACMAKAYCAEAYAKVAGEGIQIHGGLGFTWEQDLHLFYKRAKACEMSLGGVAWTRELVARQLIDRPGDWMRDSI